MSYINDSLSTNEEVQHRFYLHWSNWITIWMLGLTIIGLPIALYLAIKIKTQEFGMTNRRIIYKYGIISRTSEEMKISSMETVTIHQSLAGRLFGFGDIRITGRGTSDVIFKQIDDPIAVKKAIESVAATQEMEADPDAEYSG